jgi:hypothetical protein
MQSYPWPRCFFSLPLPFLNSIVPRCKWPRVGCPERRTQPRVSAATPTPPSPRPKISRSNITTVLGSVAATSNEVGAKRSRASHPSPMFQKSLLSHVVWTGRDLLIFRLVGCDGGVLPGSKPPAGIPGWIFMRAVSGGATARGEAVGSDAALCVRQLPGGKCSKKMSCPLR